MTASQAKNPMKTRTMPKRERMFEESHQKSFFITMSEWRVLLALAYCGPQSMYKIAKKYSFLYPSVHAATKSLKSIGWLRVVKSQLSSKKVRTKIYGLTPKGLLWLFTKIPSRVEPPIVDPTAEDPLGLRKIMDEKDISEVASLENNKDIYLHLVIVFKSKMDDIALSNAELLPLVFGVWKLLEENGFSQDLAADAPDVAFSSLQSHYYGYDEASGFEALETLFAYKLYYAFLESHVKAARGMDPEWRADTLEKIVKVFRSTSELQAFCERICRDLKLDLEGGLSFVSELEEKTKTSDTFT